MCQVRCCKMLDINCYISFWSPVADQSSKPIAANQEGTATADDLDI